MTTYTTMTVAGIPGSSYEADSFEEADARAQRDGYDVIDWTDPNTLVVS